jgi:hypothetical protein
MTIKVLLQTTIAPAADNWSIDPLGLRPVDMREMSRVGSQVFPRIERGMRAGPMRRSLADS